MNLTDEQKSICEQVINVFESGSPQGNYAARILHNTIYRTRCFNNEINRDNWDLSQRPINANGHEVS